MCFKWKKEGVELPFLFLFWYNRLMRFLGLCFILSFLIGCGSHYNQPKSLFVRDFINIDPKIQEVVALAVSDLNNREGHTFVFWSDGGDKPITFRSIDPSEIGEDVFAHARYLEYHCLIQVRTDLEQVIRAEINPSNPQSVSDSVWKTEASKIIMHEMGHCAGFNHVNDVYNIMNPTYSPFWGNTVLNNFAKALWEATR
jgi:hypothetical protein